MIKMKGREGMGGKWEDKEIKQIRWTGKNSRKWEDMERKGRGV